MSGSPRYLIKILLVLVLISTGINVSGQQEDYARRSATGQPDTSEYIPEFYQNGINYNLMIASSHGYISEIERLIARGADIKGETAEGATALIFAVSNNQPEAVKTLLKHNAPPDKVTCNYETPLLIAVKNGNLEIAEILIRAGADIDLPDRYGATPLHFAAAGGDFEITDLLLYYNAAIDQKTDDGVTPLIAAISTGADNIADLLIQNGANMEARNKDGFTPFLTAAALGDTLAMDLLLKYKIDIYEVNNDGFTALDLAIASNQPETVKYLLRKGNQWTEKPQNAIDPYKVASKYERKEMTAILNEYKVPGKIRLGIDQAAISLSSRLTMRDYYSGFSVFLKEPYINGGLVLGMDMKLWYTRVLKKESDHLFYQYWEKGYLVYGGLFKDFRLYEKPYRSEVSLSAAILGTYSFGHVLRGSDEASANAFAVVPSVALKYSMRNLNLYAGLEYLKSDFYRNGPVWTRLGLSYTLFFERIRTEVKPLNWY